MGYQTVTVHKVNTHYRQFNIFSQVRKTDYPEETRQRIRRTCKLLAHKAEAGIETHPWMSEANILTTKL